MKKIVILTGEPSGDKLASTVIAKLKIQNPNIEYLSSNYERLKGVSECSLNLKMKTYHLISITFLEL